MQRLIRPVEVEVTTTDAEVRLIAKAVREEIKEDLDDLRVRLERLEGNIDHLEGRVDCVVRDVVDAFSEKFADVVAEQAKQGSGGSWTMSSGLGEDGMRMKKTALELPRVPFQFKSGQESLHSDGGPLDLHSGGGPLEPKLCDFWKWSSSDLLSNTLRGVLAEYLVVTALGLGDKPRNEWAEYDVKLRSGKKIEIKSAAYIQSWAQRRCSAISFDIAPRKSGWNAETGESTTLDTPQRFADVYVFCLLKHCDQNTIDPLDVDQWDFYVLSTACLDCECANQCKIGLGRLRELAGDAVNYAKLACAIQRESDPPGVYNHEPRPSSESAETEP